MIKVGGANVPPDTTPQYITIENLDIRSARPPYSFTAANGTSGALINDGSNLTGATPGFLHEPAQNFGLATNSVCIDAGTNLTRWNNDCS